MVAQCLKSEKGDNNNTKLTGVLIANKTDLEDRRIISPKVGAELAQQLGLLYFECSAKDFKDSYLWLLQVDQYFCFCLFHPPKSAFRVKNLY